MITCTYALIAQKSRISFPLRPGILWGLGSPGCRPGLRLLRLLHRGPHQRHPGAAPGRGGAGGRAGLAQQAEGEDARHRGGRIRMEPWKMGDGWEVFSGKNGSTWEFYGRIWWFLHVFTMVWWCVMVFLSGSGGTRMGLKTTESAINWFNIAGDTSLDAVSWKIMLLGWWISSENMARIMK